jgi:hypothetical protein
MLIPDKIGKPKVWREWDLPRFARSAWAQYNSGGKATGTRGVPLPTVAQRRPEQTEIGRKRTRIRPYQGRTWLGIHGWDTSSGRPSPGYYVYPLRGR